jgi:hypothetical protein
MGELEQRKLELEIAELKRPFWQKAAYIGASIPIVLAVLAFLSALFSGYFNQERIDLQNEIATLKVERDAIAYNNERASHMVDQFTKQAGRHLEDIQKEEQWVVEHRLGLATILYSPTPSPTPVP